MALFFLFWTLRPFLNIVLITTRSQLFLSSHAQPTQSLSDILPNIDPCLTCISSTYIKKEIHFCLEKGGCEAENVSTQIRVGSMPFMTSDADLHVAAHISQKWVNYDSQEDSGAINFAGFEIPRNGCNGHNSL